MAKNNLDLSIVSDGMYYEKRKSIAFEFVSTGNKEAFYNAMKNGVVNPSARQARKQFGDKYSLSDIKTITLEMMQNDKEMIIDYIRDAYRHTPTIAACAREWFDRVNGNSYHSVILYIAGHIVYIPMTYGYGEQWKATAIKWLADNGFIVESRSKGVREYGIDFCGIVTCNKSEL